MQYFSHKLIKQIDYARFLYRKGKLSKELREAIPTDFWEPKKTPSKTKKEQLLNLAKSGAERPRQSNNSLGYNLSSYICKKSVCYDPSFVAQLKKIAPHWMDKVEYKKHQLIEIAKRKENRPHSRNHPLGNALCLYTKKTSPTYDVKFVAKLKKLAPHWFVKSSDVNKQKLIQLAKNNKPRPKIGKSPLGDLLRTYIIPLRSTYDPKFTAEIKKLRPDWFRK